MANPYSIEVADFGQGLNQLYKGAVMGGQAKQKREEKTKIQGKLDLFAEQSAEMTPEQVGQFLIKNPDVAGHIAESQKTSKAMETEQAIQKAWQVVTGERTPDKVMMEVSEELINKGVNAGGALNMAEDAMKGGNSAMKVAYATIAAHDPQGLKAYMLATGQTKDENLGKVGSQVILADGTIVQSTQGGPVVWDVKGKKLEGEAAAKAVKAAKDYEVTVEQKKYGARETGKLDVQLEKQPQIAGAVTTATEQAKQSQTFATDFYKKIPDLERSIGNMDMALKALDEGAQSGAIADKFPNLTDATVALQNAQMQMGLDVVKDVTFGALSEKELQVAFKVGLPMNMSEEKLREWIELKKSATQKQITALKEASMFFAGGGKLVDYMQMKGAPQSAITEAQKKEGSALGSAAASYPDGTIAEDPRGNKVIKQGGRWVPHTGGQ